MQNATADGETRTISFHHLHTKEDLTVTYKRNGRYDEYGLQQINHLMRDWREQEPIKMDPHLIHVLWEVHREVGGKEPISVICGYRSSGTNPKLRRRSSGVAKFSLHMQGKAIDFHIPGVPLKRCVRPGCARNAEGSGFSVFRLRPLDTGNVRHWPRMPEAQLARVLSKGQLASRSASDNGKSIAVAQAGSGATPSFLSKLFGGDQDAAEAASSPPAAAKPAASARSASVPTLLDARPEQPAEKPAAKSGDRLAAVPVPLSRPVRSESFQAPSKAGAKPEAIAVMPAKPAADGASFELAATSSKPVRLPPTANLAAPAGISANEIINDRGYWRGLPGADSSQSPDAARTTATPAARRPVALASADPAATANATPWAMIDRNYKEPPPSALAYAAQPTSIAAAPALTDGGMLRAGSPADTTIAVKRSGERPSALPGKGQGHKPGAGWRSFRRSVDARDDREPSAQGFMRTTLLGATDFRNLGPYMQKPGATVMMTFTADPHLGMTCEKFAGSAVVFISTVTFGAARTASSADLLPKGGGSPGGWRRKPGKPGLRRTNRAHTIPSACR